MYQKVSKIPLRNISKNATIRYQICTLALFTTCSLDKRRDAVVLISVTRDAVVTNAAQAMATVGLSSRYALSQHLEFTQAYGGLFSTAES